MDKKIERSRAQEARGAALHGGSRNSGSGNTPWRKNDVRVDRDLLIEYKRTDGKSIRIKQEDLEQLRVNALLEGREALFGFELGGRDYVVVDAADYERSRSSSAGARLDGSEVLPARGRSVLPTAGPAEQDVAESSPSDLPRRREPNRRAVSRPRGVS